MQCLGRLCVVKHDTIPLFLYTTDKVREDLRNAYYLQEELIKRANDRIWKSKYDNDTMSRIIQDVSIWSQKVPKRDLIKKEGDVDIKLKVVADEATDLKRGGWKKDKTYINVDEEGNELEVEYLGGIESSDEDQEDTESSEEESEGKYTVIDQEKLKPNTKVYKMISDVIAVLIEEGKYNTSNTASSITKKLQESKYSELSTQQIYSTLWSMLPRLPFIKTNKILPSSLLCWKDNVTLKVMLTK